MEQPSLEYLIDLARKHEMTDEEREAHRRSFTYGNIKLHNPKLTLEDVDRAIAKLKEEEKNGPIRTKTELW